MEEGEVAGRKGRGEDAEGEHLDEVFVDPADDDALDDLEDEDEDGGELVTAGARRSSSAKSTTGGGTKLDKTSKSTDTSVGLFERIARFLREVVAELRKVNWPSRNELITYTTVVVVFVVIMMSIVAGLDWVFATLITHVFG